MSAGVSIPASFKKFARIACPPSVRIDSGWNCTPNTGQRRWASAMMTPSSVRAVTSSSFGSESGSTTSEWYRPTVSGSGNPAKIRRLRAGSSSFARASAPVLGRSCRPGPRQWSDAQGKPRGSESCPPTAGPAPASSPLRWAYTGPAKAQLPSGRIAADFVRRNRVIADNNSLLSQPPQIARQVMHKAVVIVDEQNHSSWGHRYCSARSNPSALCHVSSYSRCGEDCATMPPPTGNCHHPRPQ